MTAVRVLARSLLVAVVTLLAWPASAWADPAVPTNWRSRVTAVDPAVEAVSAEVVGGDAFLRLRVAGGTSATVFGYGAQEGEPGEPYLRFHPDGTVEVNVNSAAHHLNQDRYGGREAPEVSGGPEWIMVAGDGSYAWHDHRIHWMLPQSLPPGPRENPGEQQVTDEWAVPIEVDGQPVLVRGELVWVPDVSPLLPALVGLALAVGAFLAVRATRWEAAAVTATVANGVAAALAVGEVLGSVDTGFGSWLGTAFAGLGAATSVAAFALRRAKLEEARRLAMLGAAFAVVFALQRVGGLTEPILPTALADWAARYGLVAVLGIAVGGLAALPLTRGGARSPVEATGAAGRTAP